MVGGNARRKVYKGRSNSVFATVHLQHHSRSLEQAILEPGVYHLQSAAVDWLAGGQVTPNALDHGADAGHYGEQVVP